MRLIDTHAHIFAEEFDLDKSVVIDRAINAGAEYLILPNIDAESISPLLALCSQYPKICKPALGLHPTSVDENYEATLSTIYQSIRNNTNCIAIGEIGVDLYWDKTHVAEQCKAFKTQIEWALELDLPIIIHQRDSFDEILMVLNQFGSKLPRGVFHCFGGTLEQAQTILDKGFYLGIGGVVTFKKSTLPEVLAQIPIQKLVIETDAPYLSPTPFRGKRNEPAYLPYIVDTLADIYKLTTDEVASITTQNAINLFKLQ
jgi:TatD DNase family protein